MTDPVLVASELSFAYGERRVLVDVNLTVRRGEMVGIIGPNGSGKSTLLRILCGLLRPSAGRVLVAGEDLSRLSRRDVARRMAVVPQTPHLPASFTAWEVALLGRTPHLGLLQGESKRDLGIVRRAMEVCDTLAFGERRMGDISGGEAQRVVIARALAQEPSVLLLDEPTSHLDINHQAAVLDLIAGLSRERDLAVVAVLHDLNLAAQYCQRLLILADGKVRAEGTPAEVVTTVNIQAAYGADVCVMPHPHNQLPVALLARKNGHRGERSR